MRLGAGSRDGRVPSHRSFQDDLAGEVGERLAIMARVCPWGWHRRLDAEELPERVGRAYALHPYHALWELEALGYRYAATAPELAAGETPPALPLDRLPAESWTMLHVGFGMALARRRLAGARDEVEARVAVRRFLDDTRRTPARFRDAVVEPLGVVARFEHPQQVGVIGRMLAAEEPGLASWYWHGVGRCHLFLPSTFLPVPGASWRALVRIERHLPLGPPRRRARVGWACGLTLIHMRRPQLVAAVLAGHGEHVEAASDGFAEDFRHGVAQAVEIRRVTTPGCGDLVEPFLAHRPADRPAAARWHRLVGEPGLAALAAPLPCDGTVFSHRPVAPAPPVRRRVSAALPHLVEAVAAGRPLLPVVARG